MELHITPEQADEYAIGSLEPDVERFVQLHIAECHRCSELVADAELVAARFALSAPLRPAPPALRERVFVSAGLRGPSLVSRMARIGQAAAGISAVFIAVAAIAGMFIMRGQMDDLRKDNQELRRDIEDLGSQEVQIFAISQRLYETEASAAELRASGERNSELMAAMLSPNSQIAEVIPLAPVGGNAIGRLVWDEDQSRIWFVAQRLPRLAEDETFQVWLISDGEYINLGSLEPDEFGTAVYDRVVPEGLESYDSALVTIETAGSPGRQGDSVFQVPSLRRPGD